MTGCEWLLFTPQTPVTPSSLRVTVWRRMQSAGAVSLQNGVWLLPRTSEHEGFIRELLAEIERQGGTGFLFTAHAFEPAFQERIVARFHAERDQEYAEFCERCQEFLHEIEKETQAQKFTFAELEENEHDLLKLTSWFRKIQSRDFFHGTRADEAEAILVQCRHALQTFTSAVYSEVGLPFSEESTGGKDMKT